jgi:hypothetical protein
VLAGLVPAGPVPTALAVTFVLIRALQVTVLPPGFPEPLHWLIRMAIARLTVDRASTVHDTVPPPPLPEPLHCVMVAVVVLAGVGRQPVVLPPPPCPEPTHWLTVAGVRGVAWGVSPLMLFTTLTSQTIR